MNIIVFCTDSGENMVTLELEDFHIKSILDCGQSFRWQEIGPMDYVGVAGGKVIRVLQTGKTVTFFSSQEDFDHFWRHYFDLDRDYKVIKDWLLVHSPDLEDAIAFGGGIRLLNQDLFEMLITFILSANNHIPRIRDLVRKLSIHYGQVIPHPWEDLVGKIHSFPTPQALAQVPIEDLRALGLGYRDAYVLSSAQKVYRESAQFESLLSLPYEEAKAELLTYLGVGPKVADCILLFSASAHEAFPIDTWIKKTLSRRYMLDLTKNKALQIFIDERFGEYKGFAQQYLFYFERENER